MATIKRLLKKSPLYPLLRRLHRALLGMRANSSKPVAFHVDGVEVKFNTDDPYSYHWFFPRYAGAIVHEESATRAFIEMAGHSNVIADVGTNLGWFACCAARANPEAQVHAFELDAANLDICRKNIHLNRIENITLVQAAVASHDGELTFAKHASHEASAEHRIGLSAPVRQEVRALRLDTYFRDRPKPELMKIDVEGAEQLVLGGMPELLGGSHLRTIMIEIHPAWIVELGGSVRQLLAMLEGSGFTVHALSHRSNSGGQSVVDPSQIEAVGSGGRMFVAHRSKSI